MSQGTDPEHASSTSTSTSTATSKPGPANRARVVTSIAVILPVLLLLILGGPFIGFMLLVPPVIVALEWSGMASRVSDGQSVRDADATMLVPMIMIVGLSVFLCVTGHNLQGIAVLVVGSLALAVLGRVRGQRLRARGLLFAAPWVWPAGALYAALPYMAGAQIAALDPNGAYLLMALMATVWCGDIGAYFVGKRFGNQRLPVVGWISPNKSLQGLLGGLVAGSLGFLYFVVFTPLPLPLALAAPVLSLLAHLGDLVESGIKRYFGRKDSGGLLPGHGGLMDRMDGFAVMMPIAVVAIWFGAGAWLA